MDAHWILVANKAAAYVYSANQRGEALTLIDEFMHEAGKAHFHELVSDAPGRVHDRQGATRHSMEINVGVQQDSIRRFARKIVDYLEAAAEQGTYRRLILVAAPAFLGILRKYVDRGLADQIVLEIPKDMVGRTVDQLQTLLNRKL
jgi:protein required for attachment to host cells